MNEEQNQEVPQEQPQEIQPTPIEKKFVVLGGYVLFSILLLDSWTLQFTGLYFPVVISTGILILATYSRNYFKDRSRFLLSVSRILIVLSSLVLLLILALFLYDWLFA